MGNKGQSSPEGERQGGVMGYELLRDRIRRLEDEVEKLKEKILLLEKMKGINWRDKHERPN